MSVKLKYVGNGKQLPGIPKRDLKKSDFAAISKRYGWHRNNIPSLLTGNKNSIYELPTDINDIIALSEWDDENV